MKILLTGSAGFIGIHLERALLKLGHEVLGYDLKISALQDIRNLQVLSDTFDSFNPEVVIHLAALAGVRESVKSPIEYLTTNINGTYNLLRFSEEYGVKKFLFASSSSVYGNQECPLRENMECAPVSVYGFSKYAGELLCKMFDKVPTIVFRPFTVYGEGGRPEMVVGKLLGCAKNNKVFSQYGDGLSVRGYTNVHDLVDGIVKLLDFKPDNNFEVFNLGGSQVIELRKLVEFVRSFFPNLKVKQVASNPLDMFSSYADTSKAKALLDWQPIRSFNDEIETLCLNLLSSLGKKES